MPTDSRTPQESSVGGSTKSTPLQDAEYAKRCTGVPPAPEYKNLEERSQYNNVPKVIPGETGNVQVVRTFYTYRATPESGIHVWYADGEFGFYEEVPQRVANLSGTHVHVGFQRESGIYPTVDLAVFRRNPKTGKPRPIWMHEFIETIIYDDDEDWMDGLSEDLTQWELIFPERESWGVMRIVGYPESPGPSQPSESVYHVVGDVSVS